MESSRTDLPHNSTKGSTTNMATVANIPQPKANLLSLPGEIRNIIYRMVLTNEYTYDPVRRRFGRLETALLHVNRKVRTESTAIFQGANIWICVGICASKADHTSFKNDVPLPPQRYPGFLNMWPQALLMNLEVRNEINNGQTPLKMSYVVARESIKLLVRWLWTVTSKDRITAWRDRTTTGNRIEIPIRNSRLELCLYTSLFHSRTKLQEICLEPFALIGTLASIKIEGDVDPAVRKQLVKRIKSLLITTKSAIEIGNDHLQRGDMARRCGDHLEACSVFEHGNLFMCHAVEYSMASSKISAENIHTKYRILLGLMAVLRSRLARALLYIGQFKPAKILAISTLTSRYTTDVDRLNLLICKVCAQRGLCEGTDDSDRGRAQRGLYEDTDDSDCDCPPIVGLGECEEIISILGQMPRTCIRTYFETFPSTVKGLEELWMKVEPVHGIALGGDIHVGFGEIHNATTQAQDELLECSRRYRRTGQSSKHHRERIEKAALADKKEGSIEQQITDIAYTRAYFSRVLADSNFRV